MWYKIRGQYRDQFTFFIVEAANIGDAIARLNEQKEGVEIESADLVDYEVIPK